MAADLDSIPVPPLGRNFGMRARFVVAAISVYLATLTALWAVPSLDQALVFNALEWLFITIGAGVTGDTVRPSGRAKSAFSGSAVDDADM